MKFGYDNMRSLLRLGEFVFMCQLRSWSLSSGYRTIETFIVFSEALTCYSVFINKKKVSVTLSLYFKGPAVDWFFES